MLDAYDEAVEYFTAHEKEIYDAWLRPEKHIYGYLFGYLTPSRKRETREDGLACGCPTIIKMTMNEPVDLQEVAWTDDLTMAIRCDESIPRYFGSMLGWAKIKSLPAIAQAQRLADHMLGRPEPNAVAMTLGSGI